MYLAFKDYQIDKALISMYVNIQELIQLIKIEHSRVKVSYSNTNLLLGSWRTRNVGLRAQGCLRGRNWAVMLSNLRKYQER